MSPCHLVVVFLLSLSVIAKDIIIPWDFSTPKTFSAEIGDVLEFRFNVFHNVFEGPGCTGGKEVCSTQQGGNGNCRLEVKANTFYYCAISGHCGSGMKTQVVVLNSNAPTTTITRMPTVFPTKRPQTKFPTKRPKTKFPTKP